MPLHHADFQGRGVGLAAKEVDDHVSVRAGRFQLGEIVIALALSGVDRKMLGAVHLDDIAEGGEGLAGKRISGDDTGHAAPLSFACRFMSL